MLGRKLVPHLQNRAWVAGLGLNRNITTFGLEVPHVQIDWYHQENQNQAPHGFWDQTWWLG
jgi:hypothetical protein